MKKALLLTLALAAMAVLGWAGIRVWRSKAVARVEERAFARASELMRGGHPNEALAVADAQPRSDERFAWSRLETEALVGAKRVARLVSLHGKEPARVLANEEASLLVARAYYAARLKEDFQTVRSSWLGREVKPELWLALDSDILGAEGKQRESEQLLRSKQFAGEAEATRLVRVALRVAGRNLQEAWDLLDRAYLLAPKNTEIRSFRAQILESLGKTEAARVEYVAAHVADPANPLLRDELGEFYRRQGSYDMALQTWRDAMVSAGLDSISLKEAFWGRVVQPAPVQSNTNRIGGVLSPLADFLRSIGPDRFWNEETFAALPQGERFARERQELFWLRLLEALRTGKDAEASELLNGNRFRPKSWRPEVETALVRILNYRAKGSLLAPGAILASASTNSHPFLAELTRWAETEATSRRLPTIPRQLDRFLRDRNAFAAAFLAAGWREAALVLAKPAAEPEDPSWFAYGIAQCLRHNRGNKAALARLSGAPLEPSLSLLKGELLLAEKQLPEALRELGSVARNESDAGERASWLLAMAALESGDTDKTRAIVEAQPRLAKSPAGRELRARAALRDGKLDAADTIYRTIEKDSAEAAAFLARRAFERKDWAAARRHTEDLRRLLPEELQVRANLAAIAKEEQSREKK